MPNTDSPRRSARFWTYHFAPGEGWVRIILTRERPRAELVRSSRDSEGWSRTVTVWTADFDRQVVTRETYADGCDCDGNTSRDCIEECPFSELAAWQGIEGKPTPYWTEIDACQRDYAAEAAGY